MVSTKEILVYDMPPAGPLTAKDCRVAAPKLHPKNVAPKTPHTELQGCSYHDSTTAKMLAKNNRTRSWGRCMPTAVTTPLVPHKAQPTMGRIRKSHAIIHKRPAMAEANHVPNQDNQSCCGRKL